MKAIMATARPAGACRSTAAPRPRGPALRAAPRPTVRTFSLASDVGKYLSEAASSIFRPQADDVPWEKSAKDFSGKIVHHEETARLKALELAVDSAMVDIQKSMDQAPEGGEEPKESEVGQYVMTSIQRVFGNNFKGDDTEPQTWISTGYTSRARSQRELRHAYDRLTRFQTVVKKVVKEAEGSK